MAERELDSGDILNRSPSAKNLCVEEAKSNGQKAN